MVPKARIDVPEQDHSRLQRVVDRSLHLADTVAHHLNCLGHERVSPLQPHPELEPVADHWM